MKQKEIKEYFSGKISLEILHVVILLLFFAQSAFSQPDKYKQIVFGCYTNNLDDFEQFVIKAQKEGATHIQLNAEDLPLAYWQMSPEGDPYPAWVISNPGILKTFIPDALKDYIPHETADKVIGILEERCKILRKYNLKAAFHTFEPQMLPEAVFEDHPDWRGPQVDHPMRSRTPRFAPSVDNPEVLKLYIEAMQKFISKCPEVEILVFRTNDSGAGFDWAPHLYNGMNGNTNYKNRSTQDRIKGFFEALQEGAQNAGGTLTVQVYNTYENARQLSEGLKSNMGIDGFEGPSGSKFCADVDNLLYYKRAFSPIVGIPHPLDFIEKLEKANRTDAPRLFVAISDRYNDDLYLKIYNEFWKSPTAGHIDNLRFLKKMAESEVDSENSEKLFELWVALDEAQKTMELLNTGGTIFILGCVHQRWLIRPLVPFLSELKPEEKDFYRKYQFTARSEEEADNLLLLQGSRAFTGEGGNRFISVVLNKTRNYISQAIRISKELTKSIGKEKAKEYEMQTTRLVAFNYLINNVCNVANYQFQLDQLILARSQSDKERLSQNFDSSMRSKMLIIARREIDNTSNLIKLLEKQADSRNVIDHAKTKEEEFHRLLGPNLIDQLNRKIKIMNSHWTDYNEIFSVPNY